MFIPPSSKPARSYSSWCIVAAKAFPQVALYFENSILAPDLPLLASAAAEVDKVQQDGRRLIVDSRYGVGVPWQGPAMVNGRVWPVHDQTTLWLPAGPNVIEPAQKDPAMRMLDFNGNLRSASASAAGLEFSYQSNARAAAVLNARPIKLEVDGSTGGPRDPGIRPELRSNAPARAARSGDFERSLAFRFSFLVFSFLVVVAERSLVANEKRGTRNE